MNIFKRIFATGILLLVSSFANAEQLIFSQYDGVNTWHNVYIEVNSAKDYVRPGVAYIPASNGKSQPATAGTSEVQWVSQTVTRTYGVIGNTLQVKYYKSNSSATFLDRKDRNLYAGTSVSSDGTIAGAFMYGPISGGNEVVTDPTESQSHYNDTSAVSTKGIDYVAGTAGTEAQHEDNHPARSIISVPTGIDMELFIKEFMESR